MLKNTQRHTVSATAGTSPGRSSGLLSDLSRRIVPAWLSWPGRGSARSEPVVVSGSLGQPRPLYDASMSVRTVDGVPDSARISVQAPFVDTPRCGASNVNPVYAAPAVFDHAYVDGSVQGTGSAGYVPAGTSVVGTAPFVPGSAPGSSAGWTC